MAWFTMNEKKKLYVLKLYILSLESPFGHWANRGFKGCSAKAHVSEKETLGCDNNTPGGDRTRDLQRVKLT